MVLKWVVVRDFFIFLLETSIFTRNRLNDYFRPIQVMLMAFSTFVNRHRKLFQLYFAVLG